MRRLITLTLAVILAASASAGAQTVKTLYARAQSREQAARKALDAGRPADVVRKDIARTIASYESLVAKYPRSSYSDNALWQAGMLSASSYARYRVESDRTDAVRLLKRLSTEYPSSPLMRQTKPALARLTGTAVPSASEASPPREVAGRAPTASDASIPTSAAGAATAGKPANAKAFAPPASEASPPREAEGRAAASRSEAQIKAIRRTVLPDVIRVAIELDREVDYHDERISGPDRVFVDLQAAQAGPGVRPSESWDEDVVRAVRIGPRPRGSTRVVLDLANPGRYSVFTLYNPFRVVIDLDRAAAPGALLAANPGVGTDTVVPASLGVPAASKGAALVPYPAPVEKVIVPTEEAIRPAPQVDSVAAGATIAVPTASVPWPAPAAQPYVPLQSTPPLPPPPLQPKKIVSTQQIAKEPAAVMPIPPSENLQGRFSLSRQLGLGISRIVIDPGHGGHDPGAQTRGLNEADLVLDVALRLQQLLLKTPGFEVVLTRDTDVFIPLEERTAIANRAGADLFLSIHANASRNPKARGVETYFLNFASNPDAEAVAARENSASGQTMHNLPDIVKAITLNNKLDESRDFATLVQRSMIDKLSGSNKLIRDLGVRQAPFVVLIGAGMPSILAEISFITHQQEGKLLKTPAYRQKIAEALFAGVQEYQRSLKAVRSVARQ